METLKNFDQEQSINEVKINGYESLIESMGVKILVEESTYGYQGDSILLIQSNSSDKCGFLVFGWGSCSMCDAFEACKNLEDYDNLRKSLYQGIFWDNNLEECINHIFEKPWELTHLDDSLVKRFKNSVKKYAKSKKINLSFQPKTCKPKTNLVYEDKGENESPFAKLAQMFTE